MTNQSQIKEPDDLRFIANHPVFFMQRLVMCGKEERKGRACRWSGFWGDEQITRIDVLIYEQICKNEDLPVTVRRILRADLQKRGFARNQAADFTGRFKKTEICP